MHTDEKAIIDYLKNWPSSFVSGREVARKACGRDRHQEDRDWAIPLLSALVQRELIETDHLGYYRYKPDPRKKDRAQKHVSPQILKILKSSGKSFEGIEIDEEG